MKMVIQYRLIKTRLLIKSFMKLLTKLMRILLNFIELLVVSRVNPY